MGWLLAQLNLDLPQFAGRIAGARAQRDRTGLALIPPVLAAAEEVELVRFDVERWRRRLPLWQSAPDRP